jgi:hypothetical protein
MFVKYSGIFTASAVAQIVFFVIMLMWHCERCMCLQCTLLSFAPCCPACLLQLYGPNSVIGRAIIIHGTDISGSDYAAQVRIGPHGAQNRSENYIHVAFCDSSVRE